MTSTINAVDNILSGVTGSGKFVGDTSPTLITPILGVATATSVTFSPTTGGIIGTTTNDNAGAGTVGEIISSSIVVASGVSVSPSATVVDVTSINLTAGDWDVWGNISAVITTGPTTVIFGWISSTSVTQPDQSLFSKLGINNANTLFNGAGLSVPAQRFSLSGNTTIYLSGTGVFTGGSLKLCGNIYARRVR